MPKPFPKGLKTQILHFLATFLVCLGVFLGTAFLVLHQKAPAQDPIPDEKTTPTAATFTATVLVGIGDAPATAEFYTLDIKAELQSGFLENVPQRTAAVLLRTDTVPGHAAHNGMQAAKVAAAQVVGKEVARYIFLTPATLAELCDRLGGILLQQNGSTLRYSGSQFTGLLGGQDTKDLLCRLATLLFSTREKLEDGFAFLYTACDTDISAADIHDHADALCGLTVY